MILRNDRLRARRNGRVGRVCGLRRRKLGEIVGEDTQIVVGHVLGDVVHDLDLAHFGAEQKELNKPVIRRDRKSTRLNSSHQIISYAVFCLKKKKTISTTHTQKL